MNFLSHSRSLFGFSRVHGILLNIMGKSGRQGFYAVKRGRKVGVYLSWDECKANVDKFAGARYKKFATEEDAWQFVNEQEESRQSAKAPPSYTYLPPAARRGVAASSASNHCSCCPNAHTGSSHQHHTAATTSGSQYSSMSASTKPYEYNTTMAAHASRQYQKKASGSSAAKVKSGKRQCSSSRAPSSKRKKLEQENAVEEPVWRNERVEVYTDGACSFNGQRGAKAGVGVYWGDDHPDNISQRLKGKQTNQRAEIMGAVLALEKAKSKGIPKLKLHTDSKYTINCINSWMDKWKQNGWKTVNDKDVHNREDLERLDELCQEVDVEWKYVPGHMSIKGNEAADKLATRGAQLPYCRDDYDDDF